MQNRTVNVVQSPNPTFEAQVRRQGDPNLIFVNAIPNVTSVRDHGMHLPSPYFESANPNPFHEPPKSDRGILTSFQTFSANQVEQRRPTNTSETEAVDPRPLNTFNSKSIQNKYGLGVRILEKTPRNSNTAPERNTGTRSQLGSDDLGRSEIRLMEPPRMHTPIKSPHPPAETERVIRATNLAPATFTSPTPGSLITREMRMEQTAIGQRYEGFSGQTMPALQPQSRVQVLTKTPQGMTVQSQTRINVPPLASATESARNITSNGSLPRDGPRADLSLNLNSNPNAVPASANPSPAYFGTQAFSKLGQVSRTMSQPQDAPQPAPTFRADSDYLQPLPVPGQSSKSIVIKAQNPNDPNVVAYRSPKTSYNPQQSVPSPVSPPALQTALTAASQVSGEVVSLSLEGVGTYEGSVRNNALNGYGKLMDARGRLVFEGEFVGSQFEGVGVLFNHETPGDRLEARASPVVPENWVRYEGLFHANKKSGNGYLFYADGSHFSGEFDNDAPNGFGVLQMASGETTRGVWKNGGLVSRA